MSDGEQGISGRGPFKQWRALVWSLQGLRTTFLIESSFRTEVYASLLLIPTALWFGHTPLEKALLVGTVLLLLLTELLNSAIEQVVDHISPDYALFAGRAKDMGSAAVLMAILNLLVVWTAVFGPRLYAWADR
ncbi:MAG: diacylglycerol kinase [Lysobacterales bacterium]